MYKDKYWKHIPNSYKVHLKKEKASEITEEKHLGICTIYYRVIDLILPTFAALVFGNFSTEMGGGGDFFQAVCTEKMGMKLCMKNSALHSFILLV